MGNVRPVARKRSLIRAAAQPGHVPAGPQPRYALAGRAHGRTHLLASSVSSNIALKQLLSLIASRFEEIDNELTQLNAFRDKPADRLRLTAGDHTALTVVQQVLGRLLPDPPLVHATAQEARSAPSAPRSWTPSPGKPCCHAPCGPNRHEVSVGNFRHKLPFCCDNYRSRLPSEPLGDKQKPGRSASPGTSGCAWTTA